MSFITNIILTFPAHENQEEREKEINSFVYRQDMKLNLVAVNSPKLPDGWYGGTKYLTVYIYIGAFNYFETEEFLKHLSTNVNWLDPEYVQVFIQSEDDNTFKVCSLSE